MNGKTIYIPVTASKVLIFFIWTEICFNITTRQYVTNFQKRKDRKNLLESTLNQN